MTDNNSPPIIFHGRRRTNPEYEEYLRSERWRKLRTAVRLRANGKCEICQRRDGVHCAHLTYERIFNERITDLLWACARCHRAMDDSYAQERSAS